MSRVVDAARWFAVAIVLFGCSHDSKSGTGPPSVTYSIAITAPDSTVLVGQTSQLTATLTRSDGLPAGNATIVWTSSDNNIATLDAFGILSGKAAGSVTVTASANGASAKTGIRIVPSPRENAPKIVAESVYVSETIDLRAYLLNNGNPTFMDSTTWTSSDPTVGTVDAGVFTAVKRGVSTVTATRGTKVGVVDVLAQTHVKNLSLAPDTLEIPLRSSNAFDVIATDDAGKRIFGRKIVWTVGDATKLSISGDFLTAKSGGITTVTAVCEGAVATAVVRITAPTAYYINLTAPLTWVGVGKTLAISSVVQDISNTILPGAPLEWSSSDSNIARISPNGVVTGVARGKVTVTAAAAGHKGTLAVSVEQPLASIAFVPDSVFLGVSGTLPLSPSLRDADGNSLTTRPVTWTSSDSSIVNFTPWSYFNVPGFAAIGRGAAGKATLTASADGVSGTLKVIVTSGTDRLHFDYPSVGAGTYSFYDTPLFLQDVNNQPIAGRGIRIVSSDPAIASVQPDTGMTTTNGTLALHVTTGHAGDATLTATSGTVSANYILHVAPVAVTLKIAFKPTELPVGKTYRLTVNTVQFDGFGGRHVIDWTTSDASIATVLSSTLGS